MLNRITILRRINGFSLKISSAVCRYQHVQHRNPDHWSVERYQREIIEPRINRADAPQITKDDWRSIRTEFVEKVKRINEQNVDGLIVNICSNQQHALANALSYIEMMKDMNIEINLAVSSTLLNILYRKSTTEPLSDADRELISQLYVL